MEDTCSFDYSDSGHLNNDFRTCLHRLKEQGLEAHPRGTTTKELLNYHITLTDPRNRVIMFPERKTNLKYLLGEFIWYLSGSNDPAGILPYSKFWDNIRNDGKNAVWGQEYPAGTINSNYGHRLFGHSTLSAFGEPDNQFNKKSPNGFWPVSQWNETLELLKKDKDTRQAIMNIHVPSDRHDGNKDVPCTLTLQWLIREDRLHLIVNMRSNDVILGFTNDVFQFTMLQEAMLLELREAYPSIELGHYFHNAGSMHIYDRHFTMMDAIIANERAVDVSMIKMDAFNDSVLTGLVGVEAAYQDAGAPADFDFSAVGAWALLTPYWRTLVTAFYNQDEQALHDIFGQE